MNMAVQIQVQVVTAKRLAKPTRRRPGFAARILQENSRIEMALLKEWRPR